MQTFFHVDMTGRLRSGMDIDLRSNAPSVFGKNYWTKFKNVGIKSIPSLQNVPDEVNRLDSSAYREFWLEVFRTDHPEIKKLATKSRLNSFFATDSIEDAHKYILRNGFKGNAKIFEIQSTDAGLKLDMTWLDQQFPRDFREFGYFYCCYWKGLKIDDDNDLSKHEKRGSLIEVLLGGKIIIGNIIN
ncbi:hypothetical protein [Chromobacterium sp. Panama]|uniref:hypothetical protein n=1 Tax=Chromobacterium sp. Panama TaxID=2161826 RepID=UPI0011B2926F|nr:hypothetical protein [Chromobacterium sp. Panama]